MPFFSNTTCSATAASTVLPPEVLLTIFELATDNSTRDTNIYNNIDRLVDLPPFESIYADELEKRDTEAIRLKWTLSLTCRAFRRVVMRLLVEDVWVRHGSEALLKVLQNSKAADGVGLGKFVKRITLPPVAPAPIAQAIPQILSLCPNLRILARPPAEASDRQHGLLMDDSKLNHLAFSRLHRVDWTNSSFDKILSSSSSASSDVSPRFVWRSPCLRVLSLNTNNLFIPYGNDLIRQQGREHHRILVDLPQLHTLRLYTCDGLGDPDPEDGDEDARSTVQIQLPSLQRIVLERPLALYALHGGVLASYGPQIKTLELGRYSRFLLIDAISIALGYCPNVETLFFPIFSTMPPVKNPEDRPRAEWVWYPVKHIVLNASMEEKDGKYDSEVSRTWMCVQLGDFVDALMGERTRFTCLGRITLAGSEWRELIREETIRPIVKAIRQSNRVTLDCEDDITRELVQTMI